MTENEIGDIIVNTAIRLHQNLGPGLLESVYEAILEKQFQAQDLFVQRQVVVPFEYAGMRFNEGFRADLIINNKVIIELKSVEYLNKAHKKQLLTYLRLSGKKLGYLLNILS